MIFEVWGITETGQLTWPARPGGYFLLLLYGALLLLALYRERSRLRRQSWRQWAVVLLLALLSFLSSQLFLVHFFFDYQLPPPGAAQTPAAAMSLLGAVAFIFAGAVLNPAAALLVGLASGLGRALWLNHQLLLPFHFALAAYLAAVCLQQNYMGRFYYWLRQPPVAGLLGFLGLIPLTGLAAFFYTNDRVSSLAAFDLALSTAMAHIVPLLAEGVIAGLFVSLVLIGLPHWQRRSRSLIPSPQQQSLNARLLTNFVIFAIFLMVALAIVSFQQALSAATHLVVNQMSHDAGVVATRITEFMAHRRNLLVQYSRHPAIVANTPIEREQALRQLFRTGDFYRRVILIDQEGQVVAFHPRQPNESLTLTAQEEMLLPPTLQDGQPHIGMAEITANSIYLISIIVPIIAEDGQPRGALIGQIPELSVQDLSKDLEGTAGLGSGFIVDSRNRIIAHADSDNLLTDWMPPENIRRPLRLNERAIGGAYEGRQSGTNARELVYYRTEPNYSWTVVITVPYELVLGQALQIGGRLTLVLLVGALIFALNLLFLGRSITSPLNQLVQAAQSIAGGSLNTPINTEGDDEVGQLGRAFAVMQVSLRKRLDELSLLFGVSQGVSTKMDINQGMPVILQGTIRGTGAGGVRAVVLNPSGRQPLAYGEGPLSEEMAKFDRQIMALLRHKKEIVLSRPAQVQAHLGLDGSANLSFKSFMAMPLYAQERFQGIFWLAHRQPHEFDETELNLVRTLVGQASVLVENARLFATAEGGRRRLAAVLSSTSDAVIVTDPTERILLINPAMERAFNLKASQVVGRSVTDVIGNQALIDALVGPTDRATPLEITSHDDRALYASVSTIVSNDGQVLGRVAVLHDISYLKEIDHLKSEFVATVSHDLRSPLTFMRGYATMLPMTGSLNEKQKDYVNKILGGINQMSTLVDDVLDLGRLEAGVDLVFGQVNIRELLVGIVKEHIQPARAAGIALKLEMPAKLPLVRADVALIRQAVTNLVNNALKYAPDSKEIIVSAAHEEGEIVIGVRDQGPGISKQDQLRLFEKFYRVHERGQPVVKGSGLGLSIVKTVAERHGGRAWCQSKVGEGSVFYIALPVDGDRS